MSTVAMPSEVGCVVPNAPLPTVKLGDVAEFIMGQAPPGEASNFEGVGTVFVKAGEFGPLFPEVREWTTKPLRFAKRGDVLICVVGATAGKINLAIDCAIGRSVAAIRPTKEILDRFLYLQLLPKVLALRAASTGSAQGVINKRMLADIEIVTPPLPEQRRIVAEIEKQFTRLDAGVALLRRTQANLKRYRAAVLKAACEGRLVPTQAELAKQQSLKPSSISQKSGKPDFESGAQLLERILAERRQKWTGRGKYSEPARAAIAGLPALPTGWQYASLEALTSAVRPICYGILMPKENVADGVLYVKVRDMRGDRIDLEGLHRTTREIASKYARASLKTDDLLLSIRGTYGRVAEVPKELDGGNITQDTARLDVSGLVDHRYIATCLRSPDVQNYFKRVARGVAVKGVNIGDVRPTPIALPALAEQKRIIAEVERRLSVLEELETVVNANLQRATRLRRSTLEQAFSRLDPDRA